MEYEYRVGVRYNDGHVHFTDPLSESDCIRIVDTYHTEHTDHVTRAWLERREALPWVKYTPGANTDS